ncbi:hypothetical protein [Geomicrobium sp. JCM 19038]|uniref:hypothetical protein n=1 Tax=Geomicrobium sp. JCM 19038 TaxID=1460635 RepID=UPI00045F1462|nr:hypothetical protein [Geomicrobium sp. JCM 19038]GAK08724.1 hypothetical protein JCM19038_2514 [Geomicrobium sp. JCM 19038]
MSNFKYELVNFTREGMELKNTWIRMSEQEKTMAMKDYPFDKPFEEVIDDLIRWRETLDKNDNL